MDCIVLVLIVILLIRIGNFIYFIERIVINLNQIYRKSPTASGAIPITSPSHSRSNTWFPLQFSIEIDENCELKIDSGYNKTNDIQSTSDNGQPPNNETEKINNNTNGTSKPNEEILENSASNSPIPITKKKDYKLSAVVCQINDGNQRHLVSLVYVSNNYHEMKKAGNDNKYGQWYIFNDFSIAPVSLQEAVWFTLDWKVPCVLFYTSTELIDDNTVDEPPEKLVNPFLHVRLLG